MHSNESYDALTKDRDRLQRLLDESREDAGAHLRNVERLSARVTDLEQQVAAGHAAPKVLGVES